MDINKCNIYFGNLKIKTIYFGPYKVYEDGKIPGLYFLEFGDATLTTKLITPINFTEQLGDINFLEFGTSTLTTNIITPILYQTTSELKFLKLEVN